MSKRKKIGVFIINEMLGQSMGYLAGLSASYLVSSYFVAKKAGNLWGLFSKKQAVSKDDYEWLMFAASYIIGLAVMALVNYLIKRMFGKGADDPS
jgi:hypothetical protein